ncbi:MAG: hypothetical protein KJZ86_06260 [Caldilineaceae bacterium]|nr:hypothetical protein [Caldilineaceae bacterium]HRJ40692.1 hypothetical protein [Caldilineaceae bacterium]
MLQILYEHPMEWIDDGPRTLKATVDLEATLSVSPDSARRRANGYLGRYVAMSIQADDPVLVWGKRLVWRMQMHLSLRGLGRVATVGTVDVDAQTRDVIPLSANQIASLQERANAIALRFSPTAKAAV